MKLQNLLTFIEKNAIDVADLAAVAKIKRIKNLDQFDPYRKFLIKEMRSKYQNAANEADRLSIFEEIV